MSKVFAAKAKAWAFVPLGDVFDVVGGGTPSKRDASNYGGSIPWATIRDMNVEKLERTEHTITEKGLSESSSKLIPAGEVIMASRVGLGKASILANATAINQDIRALIPKRKNVVEQRFLLYWLQSMASEIIGAGSGATVQGIKLPFIKSLQFPLPPLEEQKRIVAKLDQAFAALDRARTLLEANLADAEALFEATLTTQFDTEVRRFGTTTIEQISEHVTDGDHQAPPKTTEGFPFLTISNIDKRYRTLDFSKTFFVGADYFQAINEKRKPQQGDVLYSVTGSFGIPVIVKDYPEFCFQRHIALIRPKPGMSPEWLQAMLLSRQAFRQADDGASGTAQRTVSLKLLRSIRIPATPKQVQGETAAWLSRLRNKTDKTHSTYNSQLTDLTDLRQSLLQKAFSGQL